MTDEDGFAPPLDRDGFTGGDGRDVEFGRGQGEDVGAGAHGGDEFDDEDACGGGVGESHSREEEVGEGATFGFGDVIDAVVGVAVVDGAQFVEGGGLEGGGRGGVILRKEGGGR